MTQSSPAVGDSQNRLVSTGQEERRRIANALASARSGWSENATAHLRFPPQFKASLPAVVAAVYWTSVMFGFAVAVPKANDGDLAVVVTLAIVLFHVNWRTMRPVQLGHPDVRVNKWAIVDAVVVGGAIGFSGGLESPFALSLLTVVAVATLGWGVKYGVGALATGVAALTVTGLLSNADLSYTSVSALNFLTTVVVLCGAIAFLHAKMIEIEERRSSLASKVETLSETNDLLHMLNHVARTLPSSLDLRDVLTNARAQIRGAVDASTIVLLVADQSDDTWTPQLCDGATMPALVESNHLPPHVADALDAGEAIIGDDASLTINPTAQSGIYAPLLNEDVTVGALAIEHHEPGVYNERDITVVGGLADVLALTVDNALSFSRLRSLGAKEERSRIARDLHDRLGQWLALISLEIETMMSAPGETDDQLVGLRTTVNNAMNELRQSLRNLRADITPATPLSVVGKEHVETLAARSKIKATFAGPEAGRALPIPVESELLRILQESLHNVESHSNATNVEVRWHVGESEAQLTIKDNGVGFDPQSAVRDEAYGLVGIKERTESIGASLGIQSKPGKGTKISVTVPVDQEIRL